MGLWFAAASASQAPTSPLRVRSAGDPEAPPHAAAAAAAAPSNSSRDGALSTAERETRRPQYASMHVREICRNRHAVTRQTEAEPSQYK